MCVTTVAELKKQWKNLKDSFRANCKANKLTSEGGKSKKEWIFYKRMLFLAPYIFSNDTDQIYATMKNDQNFDDPLELATVKGFDSSESFVINHLYEYASTDDNTNRDSELSSSESDETLETFTNLPNSKRKLKEKEAERVRNKTLKVLNNSETTPTKKTANLSFFESLALQADELSPIQQTKFKIGCLEVYQRILEGDVGRQ